MESKFYILVIICLIGGLVGGYLIASTTLHNQVVTYELKIQSQDAELTAKDALLQAQDSQLQAKDAQLQAQSTLIQTQENLLQQLKANVTKLQELIESINNQTQWHLRIDSVNWGSASFTLDVRNTGSIDAVINSVSIGANQAGSTPKTFDLSGGLRPEVIRAGSHALIIFNYQWAASTSYIIRLTSSSGLYYEGVFTSPVV
jgi:TolA-binding protein